MLFRSGFPPATGIDDQGGIIRKNRHQSFNSLSQTNGLDLTQPYASAQSYPTFQTAAFPGSPGLIFPLNSPISPTNNLLTNPGTSSVNSLASYPTVSPGMTLSFNLSNNSPSQSPANLSVNPQSTNSTPVSLISPNKSTQTGNLLSPNSRSISPSISPYNFAPNLTGNYIQGNGPPINRTITSPPPSPNLRNISINQGNFAISLAISPQTSVVRLNNSIPPTTSTLPSTPIGKGVPIGLPLVNL